MRHVAGANWPPYSPVKSCCSDFYLQAAVLTAKWQWILKWQAPLQFQAEDSCQDEIDGYDGYETWLFIAWTFGDEAVFRKISRSLVLTSTVTRIDGEERLMNAQGNMVGDTMPPGSAGE